ncbi:MAG: hypothetical protein RLZZ480_194 [Candidatus Parcubacteria bacterium]|jgi:UPF0755 protein
MIDYTDQSPSATPKRKSKLLFFVSLAIALVLIAGAVLCGTLYTLNQAPTSFTSPTSVEIEPGTSVKAITKKLESASVVRSSTVLYFVITLFYDPTDIKASRYVFTEPLTATEAAKRLVAGDFDSDLIKFTHYEGERVTEIAEQAAAQLDNFDKEAFLNRALPLEGTLYPETYRIPKNFTAEQLIELMSQTFREKVAPLEQQMNSHPLTARGVIILASILEREANSPESMKVVSGILQGRMEAGMPLQADASVEYILNKPLKELTAEDLKIDSPYNTYTNRGLPPTPIGNPGLDAIMAVLEPTKTDYVFYITDNDGNFHYAKTYDEHLDNIELYLR